MEAHVVVREAMQMFHDSVGVDVMQHLLAQFAVRRVNRDIQRTGFALDHAIHFACGQVGQRDEVARHQRKTPVIVPNIQAGAHARRHLLNETEHAVIGAGLRAAHQRGFKRQTERFFRELMDMDDMLRTAFVLQQHFQRRTRSEILIIDQIEHRRAVDGDQRFSLTNAASGGKRTGMNVYNTLGHEYDTPSFSK